MDPEIHIDPRPKRPALRRRGLWGTFSFLLGGPVAAFGTKNVMEGAHTIGNLVDLIKVGQGPDRRVRVDETGSLDLQAMAFLAGTSKAGVEGMLTKRRRQTARATWCYLAGGCGFLLFWFYQAFASPVPGGGDEIAGHGEGVLPSQHLAARNQEVGNGACAAAGPDHDAEGEGENEGERDHVCRVQPRRGQRRHWSGPCAPSRAM